MNCNKIYNIQFYGLGGQGVLTASEICSWAALYEGYTVKKSEIHGMSQRGGSVESQVRFGEKVYSPIIPEGDVNIFVPFYKDDLLNNYILNNKNAIDLFKDFETGNNKISNKRMINSFMLGRLSLHLPISRENWLKAIRNVLKKYIDENIAVFMEAVNL